MLMVLLILLVRTPSNGLIIGAHHHQTRHPLEKGEETINRVGTVEKKGIATCIHARPVITYAVIVTIRAIMIRYAVHKRRIK